MANPVVTSISFNKPAYAVGEVATMTVNYSDPDTKTVTVEATVTDASGNSAKGSGTFLVDPVTLAVTDSTGRTWTQKSNANGVAVYQATI